MRYHPTSRNVIIDANARFLKLGSGVKKDRRGGFLPMLTGF
jgi:hypothetical protein